jgi:putative oxidoreductase
MAMMTRPCYADFGKLLLRVTIGALMLFHGVDKIIHRQENIDGVKKAVAAHNLPEFVAYGVYVGEVLAPAMLVVGFFTRVAALIFAFDMGVAVFLVHQSLLTTINPGGAYALELQALYFFGALAVFFLGAGRYSIDGLVFKPRSVAPPAEVKTA